MSYTLTTKATKTSLADAVAAEIAGKDLTGPAADEAGHHLATAAAVVSALAEVIGDDADEIGVSISGHANPDHGKVEGWSDEFITISVAVSR